MDYVTLMLVFVCFFKMLFSELYLSSGVTLKRHVTQSFIAAAIGVSTDLVRVKAKERVVWCRLILMDSHHVPFVDLTMF